MSARTNHLELAELSSAEMALVQGGALTPIKTYQAPGDPSYSRSEDGGSSGTYFTGTVTVSDD